MLSQTLPVTLYQRLATTGFISSNCKLRQLYALNLISSVLYRHLQRGIPSFQGWAICPFGCSCNHLSTISWAFCIEAAFLGFFPLSNLLALSRAEWNSQLLPWYENHLSTTGFGLDLLRSTGRAESCQLGPCLTIDLYKINATLNYIHATCEVLAVKWENSYNRAWTVWPEAPTFTEESFTFAGAVRIRE